MMRLTTAVIAGLLAVSGAACSHAPHQAARIVRAGADLSRPVSRLPFAVAQRQLVSPPSSVGFVRGEVTDRGTPTLVSMGQAGFGYTDFAFRVTGFAGTGPSPYANGSLITLRVPGGQVGDTQYVDPNAPSLQIGQQLYVLVREQGELGGGNTADRLVATLAGQDVYRITGNGDVVPT